MRLFSRRAAPNASYVEIANRERRIGQPLEARGYWYDERLIILTAVAGIAEVGEAQVLPADTGDSDLGKVICEDLLRYEAKSPANLRDHRLNDWGAYRASGAKSASAFEARAVTLSFRSFGNTVTIEAAPRKSLHPEIRVTANAGPDHSDIGASARRALRAVAALRAAEII
jgi:hypothetical protein